MWSAKVIRSRRIAKVHSRTPALLHFRVPTFPHIACLSVEANQELVDPLMYADIITGCLCCRYVLTEGWSIHEQSVGVCVDVGVSVDVGFGVCVDPLMYAAITRYL